MTYLGVKSIILGYSTDAANQVIKQTKLIKSGRRPSVILEAQRSLGNAKKSIKRVLTNNIFMCNLFSAWATMFFFSGLATFMAKFYQVSFQLIKGNQNA